MDKNLKVGLFVTGFLVMLMFFAVALFTKEYMVTMLFWLECIVVYDMVRIIKDKNKIVNYINLVLSNISVLFLFISITEVDFDLAIKSIQLLILRVLIDAVFIIRKNQILKKIAIIILIIVLLIIVIISGCYIYTTKTTLVKVPYEVCGVIDYNGVNGYNWSRYFGDIRPGFKKIESSNQLNASFETIQNNFVDTIFEYGYDKLKEEREINRSKEELSQKRKNLEQQFEINQDFFNKYYIIEVNESSGNSSSPMGIDYIMYDKSNDKIMFIQEDLKGNNQGATVMSYNHYFVKLPKEYIGEVEWETKYVTTHEWINKLIRLIFY